MPRKSKKTEYPFAWGMLANQGLYALTAMAFLYLGYHAIGGERGLLRMIQVKREFEEAGASLSTLKTEREALEKRQKLLATKTLDLDAVDELSRAQLSYIGKNEVMVFIDKTEPKNEGE